MSNSTTPFRARQSNRTAQNDVKRASTVEKSLPKNKLQALRLVNLYRQLKDTGDIPEQETYNDLGPVIDDMTGLINAYKDNGIPGLEDAFTTLSELNRHILAALASVESDTTPAEQEQQQEDNRFITGKKGKRVIKLASIQDIYALPDAEYLINKVLEVASVSLLFGVSGTGKTFTALNLALSVAHGIYWNGRKVKQGVVWYINTEGGRGLKKRLQAWYKEHPHLSLPQEFKIIPWSLDLRSNYQDLRDTIEDQDEDQKPTLIICDNFSMCAAGVNQNLQEEISPILRVLNMLAQDYGCHVMIVHHTNKQGDVNGTMAFRNHVDTMIELKKEDTNDKNSPIIFSSLKARDDEPFRDIKTELKQVELYTNPDTFEPVTSCVVVESETPIKLPGLKDVPQNCLDILGERTLSYTAWKKDCMDALKVSKPTFDRARDELESKSHIEKHRPEGERFEHYRKVKPLVQEESEGTNE